MTLADIDSRRTTPVALRGKPGGREAFASLGAEGTRQRDGAAGTVLPAPHPDAPRLYGPSDSECTTPGRLAREAKGRAPRPPGETLQETLVDGVQ
jgi:hypothetical protein